MKPAQPLGSSVEWTVDLLKRYESYLLSFILGRAQIDRDDAEDILAQVALTLCEKVMTNPRSMPNTEPQLVAWLKRAAIYTLLNWQRKQSRRQRAIEEAFEGLREEASVVDEFDYGTEEASKALARAAEHLGEKDSRILSMYFSEALPTQVIAEELEMSVDAVRQRKSRLVRKLRLALAEQV